MENHPILIDFLHFSSHLVSSAKRSDLTHYVAGKITFSNIQMIVKCLRLIKLDPSRSSRDTNRIEEVECW